MKWSEEEYNNRYLPWSDFNKKYPLKSYNAWRSIRDKRRNGGISVKQLPTPLGRNYEQEVLDITVPSAIITSDWHLPYYDSMLATRMLKVAKSMKVKTLIIVGDLWDIKWLSIFDIHDLRGSLKDDLAIGIQTLQVLLRYFTDIYWLMGNHEARLFRSLKWQVNLPDLVNFLIQDKRVHASEQSRMILHSGDKTWRLTHPKSYSMNAATVATQLAEKYNCNCLSAHGHLLGLKWTRSASFIGGDLGGLFDYRLTEYVHLEGDTTHPIWVNGFWAIRDGYPYVFSDRLTNWSLYDKIQI